MEGYELRGHCLENFVRLLQPHGDESMSGVEAEAEAGMVELFQDSLEMFRYRAKPNAWSGQHVLDGDGVVQFFGGREERVEALAQLAKVVIDAFNFHTESAGVWVLDADG